MTSVKNRILQFQNQSSEQENRSSVLPDSGGTTIASLSSSCAKFSNGTSITKTSTTNGNGSSSLNFNIKSRSPTPPPPPPHQAYQQLQKSAGSSYQLSSQSTTITNSMEKPVTMSKKTSLSINLNPVNGSITSGTNNNGPARNVTAANETVVSSSATSSRTTSPTKFHLSSRQPKTPTRTTSSIPKPTTTASTPVIPNTHNNSSSSAITTAASSSSSVQSNGLGRGTLWNANNANGIGHQNGPTTMTTKTTVAASIVTPASHNGHQQQQQQQQRYSDIDWKDKYEESEKQREHERTKAQHVVTLAQKATRDYEELRRRFHDATQERDKLSSKLESATGQLDSLRRASEAAYEEYYKLKKQYENENRNKSEALSRVDQYNKENRRLKRASALMMQQMNGGDGNFTIEEEAEDAVDSVENDKEISYLRHTIQELERKIVNLESELEKTKLAEFETQESFLMMNDAVFTTKSEASKLKDFVKKLENENRKLHDSLDDALVELDNVKGKDAMEQEKLRTAESELRRIRTEKNILQRQSLVFMSDTSDHRLMDALAQIGDLQNSLENQKNNFQKQISELQKVISDKEVQEDTLRIQVDARVKALEEEVNVLRSRAEEAERKLEEVPEPQSACAPPPPPPPPPMTFCPPPPPPPLPSGSGSSLNSSLISGGLKALKKTPTSTTSCESSEGNSDGSSKSQIQVNPQIDDMISQLKKGIKLRPMDRTLTRKPTEAPDKPPESQAVEEMKSILNNLKRTRRLN